MSWGNYHLHYSETPPTPEEAETTDAVAFAVQALGNAVLALCGLGALVTAFVSLVAHAAGLLR